MTRWHRPLVLCSGLMAVLAAVSLGGLLFDDRTLDGMPVWAKPLKFTASLGIYTFTWAWLLTLRHRAPRWGWWLGTALAAASAAEIAIIMFQAARGVRSHFNASTELDATLYGVMGLTIVTLMIANFAASILVLRERQADPVSTRAIRLGLAISTAGIALGYLMTLPTPAQLADPAAAVIGAHSVGVPDGGPGLPLLGWSTTGGDLRIPHFVGMHAIQALALLTLGLNRLRDRAVRLRLVSVAAYGHAGLLALVTWQALRGQPLLRPDGLTLAAAALLSATVGAAVLAAFLRSSSGAFPQDPAAPPPDGPGGPSAGAEATVRVTAETR
ncbi:hypothetical protein HS041_17480 [Planomonospora sp. ID67723]|uniref:hypothetical protein n=1 Tax=Planomonospora sp. ID67723 TaxID=2738134 RepID=UPI0018C3D5CB|nr:hypothetical protein [Planomonospora sp. ID67723]MBG0829561.1 hypothetical protein [Planomonospora sp. ID67723]